MQPVNPASVRAAKASDRKALAIIAYDTATADPQNANWRAVADMLRLALPASRTAKTAAQAAEPSRFAPWSDYSVNSVSSKRLGKSPVVVVTFADGETVRAPAVSLSGKPINIGRALRVASAFYQARIAIRYGRTSDDSQCVDVPAIVSAVCETTGAEFDPAECSARTAELRRGAFNVAATLAEFDATAGDGADHLQREAHLQAAYRTALRAHRAAGLGDMAPTEYTDADRVDATEWLQDRPAMVAAIKAATRAGRRSFTDAAMRLTWAVMTFWPGAADSELGGAGHGAPASDAAAAAETESAAVADTAPPVAPLAADMVSPAAAETRDHAPPETAAAVAKTARNDAEPSPAAPRARAARFKIPPRLLATSWLAPVDRLRPSAPPCVLRVAA
ncbi:hypothetical protein DYI24_00120 [Rhodopseudomonas sp. BR0C11]|uniref:hypothetical protein n=1 Tax=Rhodopseudomonas sp. BR0C11 TaxID=2269370 RepID=UPI0013DF62CC|nr:hypothetical protein [Rhodopseudomonas sp. BR0C11]NEV75486.1 hypothetical protein [Rhodopseudomonas sp. BR0C11]